VCAGIRPPGDASGSATRPGSRVARRSTVATAPRWRSRAPSEPRRAGPRAAPPASGCRCPGGAAIAASRARMSARSAADTPAGAGASSVAGAGWSGRGSTVRTVAVVVGLEGWQAIGNVPRALGWPEGCSFAISGVGSVPVGVAAPVRDRSPSRRRRGVSGFWLVAILLHCGLSRISLWSRPYAVRLPSGLDVDK